MLLRIAISCAIAIFILVNFSRRSIHYLSIYLSIALFVLYLSLLAFSRTLSRFYVVGCRIKTYAVTPSLKCNKDSWDSGTILILLSTNLKTSVDLNKPVQLLDNSLAVVIVYFFFFLNRALCVSLFNQAPWSHSSFLLFLSGVLQLYWLDISCCTRKKRVKQIFLIFHLYFLCFICILTFNTVYCCTQLVRINI